MKRIAFLLALFTGTAIVRGQVNNFNQSPITFQSPDAAQFIRSGNIPMDYSTGVPNISIPLYTVTCGNLSLPIGMSYNASGIKVLDIAGTAGLGWNLNAGGLVSRTVMGTNDQENRPKPYLSSTDVGNAFTYCQNNLSYANVNSLVESIDNIFKISTQQKESQSDRFFYSFSGRSGIFRTDFQTGVAKTVPYSALKISTGTNNAGPYVITAEDGTQYFFEQQEQSGQMGGNSFYTSFYLTKIQSNDLTRVINIYYKQDAAVSQLIKTYQLEHKILWHPAQGADPTQISTLGHDNEFVSYSVPVMPDSITSDNETIKFEYISDRPDLRSSRLSKIKILNRVTREVIKVIEFQHSYFGTAAANNRRLRLDNLYIKDNNSTTVQQYSFAYNSTPLPPYYSQVGMSEHHNVDYWGYYNAADDANLLPREMFDPVLEHPYINYGESFLTPQEKAIHGGNRNPNIATAQACILTEIKYPTGGKTNFEYESNLVQNGYAYNSIHPIPGEYGGLRVKKIISTADPASLPITKTYEYYPGLGTMIQSEIYQYTTAGWYFEYTDDLGASVRPCASTIISTDPLAQMSTGSGSLVLYENVREYDGTVADNNGYTDYIYDYSSLSPYIFDPGPGGNPLLNGFYLSDYGNYSPQLKTKIIYGRDQSNNIKEIRKEEYTYNKFNTGSFVTGIKIQRNHPFEKVGFGPYTTDADLACGDPGNGSYCLAGLSTLLNYYSYSNTLGILDVPLLVQKIETISPSTGTGNLITTTNYTYDLVTLQPVKEDAVNSKGEAIISLIKYPTDFSSTAPYNTMVARNILTPVIEQSVYKNSVSSPNFLKSTKTNYDFWDGNNWSTTATNIIVPKTVDTRSTNQPSSETRLRYYSYDDKSNLTTILKESDVKNAYLWGYNKSYPIAQVVNAEANEIFYDGFEEATPGWEWSLTAYDNSIKRTGIKSGRIDKPTLGEQVCLSNKWLNISLTAIKKFKFSGWVYSNGPSVEIFLIMKRAGETGYFSYVDRVETTSTGKWVYIEKIADVPADVTQMAVRVDNNGGGTVWYDDIRLHPADAHMTTFTYAPLIGMTSRTDINNQTVYYEYDNLNRLGLIRDHENNIVKKICYNYAGQTENCGGTTFYNVVKSGNFIRNNCTSGYTGSTVTYTVAASSYSSTTSQAAADQLAQNDVDNNGQAYANANGTCVSSCSFSAHSGYSNITSSISSDGTTVSFYMVFNRHTTMTAGNSYNVAIINGSCRPNSMRTINYSTSGRSWTITIYPTGEMFWYLNYGSSDVSAFSTIGTSTLTFNK